MAKNRLEAAFRSAQNPPPENGGGSGTSAEATAEMLALSIPGNYFASEQERARWQIIHQYDQEGRVAEVWNHPFFRVMEPENLNSSFAVAHPPACQEHLTSFMLQSHYREIMERILEDPEELKRGCHKTTVAEVYAFLIEGFEKGLREAIPEITAMGIYRCLERMYGEKDAYLFYRVQLSGYYREMEIEGRTFRENPLYVLKHSIPTIRASMKFVSDEINPSEFTADHRKAMDNLIAMIGERMLNVRKCAPTVGDHGNMQLLVDKGMGMGEILASHDKWQDWLNL